MLLDTTEQTVCELSVICLQQCIRKQFDSIWKYDKLDFIGSVQAAWGLR